MGDDIIMRTPAWDRAVLDAFASVPDRILFVHGRDGVHAPGSPGTHGWISQRWARAVGYFLPPYFGADFADTWINEVSDRIGRRRYIDVFTEHMHPCVGKGAWDQTHVERAARIPETAERYAAKSAELAENVETLKALIGR